MENCIVRFVKEIDYTAVEDIMKQVHAMHVAWRPDLYTMPHTVLPQAMFEEALSEKRLLVAEKDGAVIGLLLFFEKVYEGNGKVPGKMLWIDAIAVEEKYRSQGVGRKLLDALRKIARERGIERIGLSVTAQNGHARKVYEEFGFTERTVSMELMV